MIEAELPNGTILEFPEGTDTAVIQRVVKQQLGVQESEPEQGDGNLAKSALSGVIKGAVGVASLPEMAGRAILRGGPEGIEGVTGLDIGEDISIGNTLTGRLGEAAFKKAYDYEPETGLGQVVQTVGEFGAGGGVLGLGGKALAKAAAGSASRAGQAAQKAGAAVADAGLTKSGQAMSAVAAVGSEAGGELMEGTGLEGFGEFAGALIAPTQAVKAANAAASFSNKTKNFLAGKNATAPTTQSLKQEHTLAYNELDKGGFSIAANTVDDMIDNAITAAKREGADPRLHDSFNSAVSKLEQFRGQRMKLSTFNELTKALSGMVDKKSPHVLTMLKSMDNSLQKVPAVGTQTKAAERLQNAKDLYKRTIKVETLERALKKAQERTDVSGSGGNKQNNFRRAIANSLNDKRVADIWTDTERAAMERIISGGFGDNFMRLVGKMAPSGNGLMTYLNFTSAVAINPMLLGVSLGTAGVKALSDRKIDKAVKQLRDMLAGAGVPKEAITRDIVRELLGAQGGVPSVLGAMTGDK